MNETRPVESILIDRLLKGKRWLDYLPAVRGRRYRRCRLFVTNHPVVFGLIAVIFVGLIARYVVPIFVPGFWDQLSTGEIGHVVNFAAGVIVVARAVLWIDERLYFDPQRFARSWFRRISFPWQDAYDSVEITDRKTLDHHVITARHAGAVEDELTYGILVAKVADVLATATSGKSLPGLEPVQIIEMMMAQKLDVPDHQALMERLFDEHVTPHTLARAAAGHCVRGLADTDEARDMVAFWLEKGSFQLRIDLATAANHVGSQLSRGYLDLRGRVGQNALSYMGRHSHDEDFPIALIHGDAGDSLGTSAERGLIYCSGDVGDDCGKGMTGGTIVVGGRPGNRFGQDLDDRSHPAVLIAHCSIQGYLPEDSIRNGLIFLLNRDVPDAPRLLRFRDGTPDALPASLDPQTLYRHVSDYVLEWRERHGRAVPVDWS